jgi:hypothetical protein
MFARVRLPRWILEPIRILLKPLLREQLRMRLIRPDIAMIESEYVHYRQDPQRRYIEVNPAIIAVQRLMLRQYDRDVSAQQ